MKKQLQFILILLTIAILSGCGSLTAQTTPEPATATSTTVPPTQTSTATEAPQVNTTVPNTAESATEAPIAIVSFTNDVMPIFKNSCIKCHGGEQIKEGLDMRTYEGLMKGSFNGLVITPGSAEDSFLIEQLLKGEMPKRGQKLTAEQIQIITDWVNSGALNN